METKNGQKLLTSLNEVVSAFSGKFCRIVKKAKYHHTSFSRGYVKKGCGYLEPYEGKFGCGYIKHIPNLDCEPKSTYYHKISYYIFD